MDNALPLCTPDQDADLAARQFIALPPGQNFTTAWQRTLASVRLGAPAPFFHELSALLTLARQEGRRPETMTALIAELFQLGFATECLVAQQTLQGRKADPISAYHLLHYGLATRNLVDMQPLAQALAAAIPAPSHRPALPPADAQGRHGLILVRSRSDSDIALLAPHLDRRRWRVVHFVTDGSPMPDTDHRQGDDHWYRVGDLDAVAITSLIEREKPAILLDGSGHRPTQLALHRGLVPIQILMSGPISSLIPAYDWRLCDAGLTDANGTPPATDIMTERPLLLPRPLLPFVPPPQAPKPRPRDAQRPPTFGILAKPAKLSPNSLALWGSLLTGQADAHLWLHHPFYRHPAARRRVLEGLQRHGIGANRVSFSHSDTPWDALHAIDILLDPTPYGGRSSVGWALWMGKPVVTWRGDTMLTGRRAAAWLTCLGLSDWIADGPTSYAAIARKLLADRPALARWRLGLRPLLQQSPLCDIAAWANALEVTLLRLLSP